MTRLTFGNKGFSSPTGEHLSQPTSLDVHGAYTIGVRKFGSLERHDPNPKCTSRYGELTNRTRGSQSTMLRELFCARLGDPLSRSTGLLRPPVAKCVLVL